MVVLARNYRRVLLVEDIEPVLRALTRAIEIVLPGSQIEVARHGIEAHERLTGSRQSAWPIDLCISDVHLPHMSGLELAQTHCQPPGRDKQATDLRFILTTGRPTPALSEALAKLQTPLVIKPFTVQLIEQALLALDAPLQPAST